MASAAARNLYPNQPARHSSNSSNNLNRDMDSSNDTDTLLAMVSSLVTGPVPDSGHLLEALVQSEGDVEAAARLISSRMPRTDENASKKRKRTNDIETWLKPARDSSGQERAAKTRQKPQPPSAASTSASSPQKLNHGSPKKPVVDLMTVLRQPPASPHGPQRLPPLTLSNPSLVAQHTPCTLHQSILPPELACRLFYTMVNASQGWSRNKWWLFDRLVESPHRTSFYARRGDADGDETWQEGAQYWYASSLLWLLPRS